MFYIASSLFYVVGINLPKKCVHGAEGVSSILGPRGDGKNLSKVFTWNNCSSSVFFVSIRSN